MKLLLSFTLAVLFACAVSSAAPWTTFAPRPIEEHSTGDDSQIREDQIEEGIEVVRENGCSAKVCFAIDGSGSISMGDFELQKDFVLDVASIIGTDNPVSFAGVQYGLENIPISPLTDNEGQFLEDVADTRHQNATRTFLGAGIVYCDFELDVDGDNRRPTKIVVIGDGHSNFGGDPVRRARNFKEYYGDQAKLSTVGVGFEDTEYIKEIATAGGGSVYDVDNYRALSREIVNLIKDVCDMNWGVAAL